MPSSVVRIPIQGLPKGQSFLDRYEPRVTRRIRAPKNATGRTDPEHGGGFTDGI